tara:strand:- start:160 stop:309 length:150 start_codon:yes stop_codon:yes gene_type:complete
MRPLPKSDFADGTQKIFTKFVEPFIVNYGFEVVGTSDISSKPPATIEWE